MDIRISEDVPESYLAEVRHILSNSEFLLLDKYFHHHNTSRLTHSIHVSYLSWLLAKKLGCDEKAAARAGLLHDFCPYNFREKTPKGEHPAFHHPKAAVENSSRVFQINDRERDAIRTHMFPLGPVPRNKEAWIITLADKICAAMEYCHVETNFMGKDRMIIARASA